MARPEEETPAVFNELLNNDKSRIVTLTLDRGIFSNIEKFAESLLYRDEHPVIPLQEDSYSTFYTTLKSAWRYMDKPELVSFEASVREIEEFCEELFDYGSKRHFRTFMALNNALYCQTGQFTELLTKIEVDNK